MVTHPSFTRGLFIAADRQHDRVGPLCDLSRCSDVSSVFLRIAWHDVILPPRSTDRDLTTFMVQDFDVFPCSLANSFQNRRNMPRLAAIPAEQWAVGIRPDNSQ